MRTLTKTAIALCSIFALSAFQTTAETAVDTTVSWKGCGITKKAFLKACAKSYTEETGIKVKVSGGGATKGIKAAGDGSADFGGTCRGCLPSLNEDKLDLELALVAWDALVPVVHPSNPVKNISKKDLIGVFTGKVTDWSELGGTPGPIAVLVRDGKTSGVGFTFRQIILGDKDFDFGENVTRYKSSGPLEQQVEKNVGAIGVTGMSSARHREVKTLAVDGNAPTKEKIATGDYPYYRPLFLAHKKDIPANERAFLNYILGDKGQEIIDGQGTVNLDLGWKLVDSFEHFVDTNSIENYDQLMAKAAERKKTERNANAKKAGKDESGTREANGPKADKTKKTSDKR